MAMAQAILTTRPENPTYNYHYLLTNRRAWRMMFMFVLMLQPLLLLGWGFNIKILKLSLSDT